MADRAETFMEKVDVVVQILNNGSRSYTEDRYQCESDLDDQLFYQLCLLPAFAIVLIFSLTQKRRNILISCFRGKPGFVYPMDILTRTHRLSYACAFGATVHLVYKVVFENFYPFEYKWPAYLQAFAAMISMLIYGMTFFPVFACLTIGSVHGYGLGALYVWMLTAVEFYRVFYCLVRKDEIVYLQKSLPQLLCLLYLSASIPIRLILSLIKKEFHMASMESTSFTVETIKKAYFGIHVKKLLEKRRQQPRAQSKMSKVKYYIIQFLSDKIYLRQPDFLYSSRLLTTMLVGAIVLYRVAYETITLTNHAFDVILLTLNDKLEVTEAIIEATNSETAKDLEDILEIAIIIFEILRIAFLVSFTVAAALGVFNIVSAFPSYRRNLRSLYKGDYSKLGDMSGQSNAEFLAGCMRYAGYQVGYIAWGFIIQSLIILIFLLIIAVIVVLFIFDVSSWAIDFLLAVWPIPVVAVAINFSQVILARIVFLQDCGKYLALTNRRIFFIFTYFLFFYNIFMGILSCLWRIIKSMILGALLLPRMDKGLLPKDFQFSDPGYYAYAGFLRVEQAHTHPVLLMFAYMLIVMAQDKQGSNGGVKISKTEGEMYDETICDIEMIGFTGYTKAQSRHHHRIRLRWHLFYTLLWNPQLKILRKSFLHSLSASRGLKVSVENESALHETVPCEQQPDESPDQMAALNI